MSAVVVFVCARCGKKRRQGVREADGWVCTVCLKAAA
jgi:DNA-directed RNA polymerase subunit RPC12/RpoP